MLRIEFSSEELNGLRLADGPDPMWETVLSLHLLRSRRDALVFDPWRRTVRAALARKGLTWAAATLLRVCPPLSYFPDFLTPGPVPGTVAESGADADLGFEPALDHVLCTPKPRLHAELEHLYTYLPGPPPAWVRQVADGEPEALRRLGEALRGYYTTAVEPYLPTLRAVAAEDRARRAEAVLSGGPDGLLASYAEEPGWHLRGRTLETAYPTRRDLRLKGRQLTLVPSFFCVSAPVALVDEDLPPVLVHPLSPAPGWFLEPWPPPGSRAAEEAGRGGPGPCGAYGEGGDYAEEPLARLVGASRAQLLRALDRPATTSGLAATLRLALSTASRHTTVLREAGLVASRRQGNSVLHSRTPLGDSLLEGAYAPDAGAGAWFRTDPGPATVP